MFLTKCAPCCGCRYEETFDQICAYECSVSLSGVGPVLHACSVNGKYTGLSSTIGTLISPRCEDDGWLDGEQHEAGRTLSFLNSFFPSCSMITAWDAGEEVVGNYALALSTAETARYDLDARIVFVSQSRNILIKLFFFLFRSPGVNESAFPDTGCKVLCEIQVFWHSAPRALSQSESCQYSYKQTVGPISARNREASAVWMTSQYENGTWRDALPGGAISPYRFGNVDVALLYWKPMNVFFPTFPYQISGGIQQPITIAFEEHQSSAAALQWVPGSSGKENFSYSFSGPDCGALEVAGTDTTEKLVMVTQSTSITPTVTLTAPS